MSADIRYVIVGGGLAGAQAAQVLREGGATGPITLLGDEPLLPYLRPPLSKQYLQGVLARESVFIHDATWYDDHGVEVALESPVAVIRPDLRAVGLADGRTVPYDRLLLATGSSARSLDVPGADLEGVMSLRRLGDSERIKQAFGSGQRMVVVGAGWIGLEVAAAGQGAGLDVTVVEVDGYPLMRVLGPEVGVLFADLHGAHGVSILTGRAVTALLGRSGRVTGVHLSDGAVLPADLVVVGVGARPNVDVAMASGIPVSNGIVADEFLATQLPDVFAAGDVASAFHRRYRKHVRVEHWDNAKHQGAVAALNMLGRRARYDRLPFFFSDQYDVGLEYTGYAPPGGYDRVVLRGDVGSFRFIAFWLSGRRVVAAMNVNIWDVRPQLETLIRSGTEVEADQLADPDAELAIRPSG